MLANGHITHIIFKIFGRGGGQSMSNIQYSKRTLTSAAINKSKASATSTAIDKLTAVATAIFSCIAMSGFVVVAIYSLKSC